MRRDPDFFDSSEPKLIYIAKKLKESLELEKLLTEAGLDYGVEADNYRGGMIFQTERVGAFFYVRPESEALAREFLAGKGFSPTEEKHEKTLS
jgi:hypothetical protein